MIDKKLKENIKMVRKPCKKMVNDFLATDTRIGTTITLSMSSSSVSYALEKIRVKISEEMTQIRISGA